MRKHGPWTILHSQQVYRDAWIDVNLDKVTRPDGREGTYSTVRLKSGVCVIAIDQRHNVHLTREFHYAVGRYTIEGVSGGIEQNESPRSAAERELAEELGLRAARWRFLGQVDPFTAAIVSTVDLFLALDLSECDSAPDGTEQIEHIVLSMDEAVERVRRGEITHAPTCIALLRIALDAAIA